MKLRGAASILLAFYRQILVTTATFLLEPACERIRTLAGRS